MEILMRFCIFVSLLGIFSGCFFKRSQNETTVALVGTSDLRPPFSASLDPGFLALTLGHRKLVKLSWDQGMPQLVGDLCKPDFSFDGHKFVCELDESVRIGKRPVNVDDILFSFSEAAKVRENRQVLMRIRGASQKGVLSLKQGLVKHGPNKFEIHLKTYDPSWIEEISTLNFAIVARDMKGLGSFSLAKEEGGLVARSKRSVAKFQFFRDNNDPKIFQGFLKGHFSVIPYSQNVKTKFAELNKEVSRSGNKYELVYQHLPVWNAIFMNPKAPSVSKHRKVLKGLVEKLVDRSELAQVFGADLYQSCFGILDCRQILSASELGLMRDFAEPKTFKLIVSNLPGHQELKRVLEKQLKTKNFKVVIEAISPKNLSQRINTGNYELALANWSQRHFGYRDFFKFAVAGRDYEENLAQEIKSFVARKNSQAQLENASLLLAQDSNVIILANRVQRMLVRQRRNLSRRFTIENYLDAM